jgi:hypothetical protein
MDPYKVLLLLLLFCARLLGYTLRLLFFFGGVLQYRPSSSFNSPMWSTNSGAPVWNNDNSLTVGPRGQQSQFFFRITY